MVQFSEAIRVLNEWRDADEWAADAETLEALAGATETINRVTELSWLFEARVSDDDVKSDLELTCMQCGEVVCDIEHGDTIGTLLGVIEDHTCTTCDRHGGPWGSDETCARCTFEDGSVRPLGEPGPMTDEEDR